MTIGQMVTPWLGTGPLLETAADVAWLEKQGVTHIIDACAEKDTSTLVYLHMMPEGFLWNGYRESEEIPEDAWYHRSLTFAMKPLLDRTRKRPAVVYAHCSAGELRGPTTAYVILRAMRNEREEALDLIWKARPNALPIRPQTHVRRYLEGADRAILTWEAHP